MMSTKTKLVQTIHESERQTYVTCQTGKCAQTFPIEQVNAWMKDSEASGDGLALNCPDCDGTLTTADGRGWLTGQQARRPFITAEESLAAEARERRELEDEKARIDARLAELNNGDA